MPFKPTTIDVPAGDGLLSRWWFGPKPTGEVYADLYRDGRLIFDEGAYPIMAGESLAGHAARYLQRLKDDSERKAEKIAAKLAGRRPAADADDGRPDASDSVPSLFPVPS